ncbi:MAG: ATP phosphoribosyltransferase [Moraxellaceae bacterium]|nr:ATP phosphoribosyltransferase [Moraxellaceae bacterium]MDP1775637.1 ATP phosphoribosyltransferase [Moraxellaceae bacterium]MDZ4298962.1 ATP phosphoribosyltransferase [Moraxellaceae bacterium]MDZ4388040.1 ATP phosphoribosyltransferase [Moraxellaceae bacterium]
MSLTIALSKGRILKDTLPLLEAAGIRLLEDPEHSRKLIFPTSRDGVNVVILRATDVPTFVQHGAADIGVAGKDVLVEHGADGMYELVDLNIARCRLMVAGKVGAQKPDRRLRVATKFINIAKRYYAARGEQVELIKLYGSMELAPIMDMADVIVDVVDTGKTLKENGLEPLELIMPVSSRLIVNKTAMKLKQADILPLVQLLEAAVAERVAS